MKVTFRASVLLAAIFTALTSCSKDPVATIENLKTAIAGETNANAKYLAFQKQAEAEKLWRIANLFEAAAYAEAMHVKEFNKVLNKLGEPEFKPTAEKPDVKTTAENVQAAISGEINEFDEMYPGFISIAKKEKCSDAVAAFTWVNLAEENHEEWFVEVLSVLRQKESDQDFHRVWFVCQQCGGLFLSHFSTCKYCYADWETQYFKPQIFEALY